MLTSPLWGTVVKVPGALRVGASLLVRGPALQSRRPLTRVLATTLPATAQPPGKAQRWGTRCWSLFISVVLLTPQI